MTTIIFIIIGLVAGYFFLTKFEKIDRALFSSIEGYESFGILVVYVSAFIGAVFGCMFLYSEMVDKQADLNGVYFTIIIYLAMMVCASIFQAFIYLDSVGGIIGKSIFMIISCALAMAIGAVTSVVVVLLVILYLVLMLMGKVALSELSSSGRSSSGSSSSSANEEERRFVTDDNGFERELHDDGFGSYHDDHGTRYKKGDGYNTVVRDDD